MHRDIEATAEFYIRMTDLFSFHTITIRRFMNSQKCKEIAMYRKKAINTIDFRNVKNYLEMHDIIRESLDFPNYYGRNWDAFWDCITDYFGFMEPVRIEILGLDVIERLFGNEAEILVELLRKAKYYCKDLNPDAPRLKLIEIVDGDKRTEIK